MKPWGGSEQGSNTFFCREPSVSATLPGRSYALTGLHTHILLCSAPDNIQLHTCRRKMDDDYYLATHEETLAIYCVEWNCVSVKQGAGIKWQTLLSQGKLKRLKSLFRVCRSKTFNVVSLCCISVTNDTQARILKSLTKQFSRSHLAPNREWRGWRVAWLVMTWRWQSRVTLINRTVFQQILPQIKTKIKH